MKLSIGTRGIRESLGDEVALRTIRDAGFDAVDYTLFSERDEDEVFLIGETQYLEHAYRVRELLDELGMVCNQAHAGSLWDNSEFDLDNPTYSAILRAMEAASIMGASQIVVHPLFHYEPEEGFFERTLAFYKSLEQYAEKFHIRIGVENGCRRSPLHNTFVARNCLGRPEEMNAMIDQLGTKNFTACIDLSYAGYNADVPMCDMIRKVGGERIGALHVQDGDYGVKRHLVPYFGKYDWEDITSALAEIDYRGDFTYETFYSMEKVDAALMPSVLKFAAQIGGHLIKKIEQKKAEML